MLIPVHRRGRAAFTAVVSSALLALSVACGGGDGATGPGGGGGGGGGGGVASVAVSPSTATITVGSNTTLSATPTDANGAAVSGQTITWSSSNSAVATVNSSGVVTGVAGGTATITASTAGKSGSAVITVNAPVASVTISPSTVTLYSFVADSTLKQAQLSVVLKDAAGNQLNGRTVTYTSSNPAVATVSASGLVQTAPTDTLQTQSDTITVSSEGKSATAIVTVIRPAVAQVKVTPASASIRVGQSVTVTVDLYDSQGRVLGNRLIYHDNGNPSGIVSVSGGTITGVAAGTTTVSYSSEGVSGSTVITVTP
jgi:uncharacterized protein YjdB